MTKTIFQMNGVEVVQPTGFTERVSIPVEGDAIDAPVYESHQRSKNWASVLEGKNAANMQRHFLPQRGRIIDVSRLEVGTAFEIAGDYYSGSGTPHPLRFIGVVVSKGDDELIIDQYETVAKALSSANKGILSCVVDDEDHDVLAGMADPGPFPVHPGALAASVAELEAWLKNDDGLVSEIKNEVSFGESILLVLHELKRLQGIHDTATA